MIKEIFLSKIIHECQKFGISERDIRYIKKEMSSWYDLDIKDSDYLCIFLKTKNGRILITTDKKDFCDRSIETDYSYFVIDIGRILKSEEKEK